MVSVVSLGGGGLNIHMYIRSKHTLLKCLLFSGRGRNIVPVYSVHNPEISVLPIPMCNTGFTLVYLKISVLRDIVIYP